MRLSVTIKIFLFLYFFFGAIPQMLANEFDERKKLTVKISAGQNYEDGTGFIVGAKDKTIYIATALHVVCTEEQGNESNQKDSFNSNDTCSKNIRVLLYGISEWKDAEVVCRDKGGIDFALLKVLVDENIDEMINAVNYIERSARGDKIYLINRNGTKVGGNDSEIRDADYENKKITAYLKSGISDSGSSVFAKNGLIGMILESNGDFSTILPVSHIMNVVSEYANRGIIVTTFRPYVRSFCDVLNANLSGGLGLSAIIVGFVYPYSHYRKFKSAESDYKYTFILPPFIGHENTMIFNVSLMEYNYVRAKAAKNQYHNSVTRGLLAVIAGGFILGYSDNISGSLNSWIGVEGVPKTSISIAFIPRAGILGESEFAYGNSYGVHGSREQSILFSINFHF